MNRNYTSSQYLNLIENIKKIIPGVSISTDIITGFPTETEEDHRMTIELMKQVRFDGAFMFAYSPREKTKAWSMTDDVSQAEKVRRLSEIIEIQNKISYENNLTQIGKHVEVLIEGTSKRSDQQLKGRTATNKKVIFPRNGQNVGDLVTVKIESVNSATLFGTIKD
jgi:tRNA-2-methylthio-N6-dimethylallyladenosine synthase